MVQLNPVPLSGPGMLAGNCEMRYILYGHSLEARVLVRAGDIDARLL
jgi:hypothetical protein